MVIVNVTLFKPSIELAPYEDSECGEYDGAGELKRDRLGGGEPYSEEEDESTENGDTCLPFHPRFVGPVWGDLGDDGEYEPRR